MFVVCCLFPDVTQVANMQQANSSHRFGLRNTAELPHIRLEAGKTIRETKHRWFLAIWKTIWKPSGKASGNHLEKHRNHLETPTRLAIDSYPIDSIDVLVEV